MNEHGMTESSKAKLLADTPVRHRLQTRVKKKPPWGMAAWKVETEKSNLVFAL